MIAVAFAAVLAGAALQALAVSLAFRAGDPTLALAAYAAGILLGAEGIFWALPAAVRRPALATRIYTVLAALFVPVVGLLGSALGAVVHLRWPAHTRRVDGMQTTAIPALPVRPATDALEIHGHGSLFGRLRNAQDPVIRLRAVMAARQMRGREAIPLLRLALRDPNDEVRLLGYAILDQREGEIYRRINDLTAELAKAAVRQQGPLRVRLAEQYWELAYQGLAEGELLKFVLTQARTNLEKALVADPSNGSMRLLLGRVQLKQGDYVAAEASFITARKAGMPGRVVHLHLAEASFAQRRFDDVRRYVASLSATAFTRSTVRHLAQYWGR